MNEDTAKPEVNKNFPRLYGHWLCPYVEKVRLTLGAHNVEYQKALLDLNKKTSWHIELNGGVIPFLEMPDG